MQQTSSLQSSENEPAARPVPESHSAGPANKQASRVLGTPFSESDAFRRLNLGEAAKDLASCPEEALPVDFDAYDGPLISWGVATAQGQRMSMEDAYLGVADVEGCSNNTGVLKNSFFGVFDGHGGVEAAEYARDHLLDLVVQNESFLAQPGEALNTAFLQLDEHFYQAVKGEMPAAQSGSTVLAALLRGAKLWVANAGDSRAVMCSRGKAVTLTEDHRPSSKKEELRVISSGGSIDDGYLGGHLGVTRGIGDYHLGSLKSKIAGANVFQGPLTAEPQIGMFTLKSEDEFIIMACDGLWDTWSSQRVIEIARQNLQQNDNDPRICAQHLVDVSAAKHVSDNVTVLVICLSGEAPPRRGGADLKRSVSQNGISLLKSALQRAEEQLPKVHS